MNYPAASCEVSTLAPPLMGGAQGEGEIKHKITSTLTLPHQLGRERRKPQAKLREIL